MLSPFEKSMQNPEIVDTWDDPVYWLEAQRYYADIDDAYDMIVNNDAETMEDLPELLYCCDREYPTMISETMVEFLVEHLGENYISEEGSFGEYVGKEDEEKLEAVFESIKPQIDQILKDIGWSQWNPIRKAIRVKEDLIERWREDHAE